MRHTVCKDCIKCLKQISLNLSIGIKVMNKNKSLSNSLEVMRKFSEVYAERTGTFFCTDLSVTSVVIEGLAKHKDDYGFPLCPCRHYGDKEKEVKSAYWNCPCVPMRERKECHCMLFLKPDNEFAGGSQTISL